MKARQPIPANARIPSISPPELAERLRHPSRVLVLDVRQPNSYSEFPGVIPGSMRLAPSEIPDMYRELPRDRLIVTYCT